MFFVSIICLALSCSKQDDIVDIIELGAPQASIVLPTQAGDYDVAIWASEGYTASISGGKWLSFNGSSSTKGFGDGNLKISVEANNGQERTAVIALRSGYRNCEISVTQKGEIAGGIEFQATNALVKNNGGKESVQLLTAIETSDLDFSVIYDKTDGWIMNIQKTEDLLTFDVIENTFSTERHATIVAAQISNPKIKASLHITQPGSGTEYPTLSFEDLKTLVASGDEAKIEKSYIIEGVVINDNSEGNGASNKNISTDIKDETLSSRVVYIQNESASMGVMLEFDKAEENVLTRFSKVKMLLKGLTLKHINGSAKEPERIEITGAALKNILSSEKGTISDLQVKEKTISQLTDSDIYTYVTLTDCEIPIRKGPFVPIDLRYKNTINKYPMILRDKEGASTYLMTNVDAAWARDGQGIPEGSGQVSGVIVHEKCDNFEWDSALAAQKQSQQGVQLDYITEIGTISRYQIRPVTKAEIAISNDFENGFSDMIMEIRYINRNYDNIVKNTDSKYTIYSTYPAVDKPMKDSSIKGKLTRWTGSSQGAISLWYDWTLLGPVSDGILANRNAGNGVYDYNGKSAVWTSDNTSLNGRSPDKVGSAGYSTSWNTNRYWLATFSTKGLSASNFPLSVNFGAENGQGDKIGAPRYWVVEYSTDNKNWTEVKEYTVPDFPSSYNRRAWQCPGFKYVTVTLPEDSSLLDKDAVYVRLRPLLDEGGSANSYDGAKTNSAAQSAINYFSIRYNK